MLPDCRGQLRFTCKRLLKRPVNADKSLMSRNDQVSRVLRVLHYLEGSPRGLRAIEILSRLKDDGIACSRETVYRDLRALQKCGVALVNEAEEGSGHWRIAHITQVSKKVSFAYSELIALYIAKESLKALQGSPFQEVLENFFTKLEKILGDKARDELTRIAEHISIRARPQWAAELAPGVLETIHLAAAEGHVLEIDYRSASGDNAGRVATRKVGPVNLHFSDSGGYLIAWDFASKMYKTFAIPRILRAQMLEEVFDDHGFDVDRFFHDQLNLLSSGAVEEIELFVAEPIASYVAERQHHPSQVSKRKDGGVYLTFQLKVNDEVARWVLSLGPDARVLRPASLVKLVASMAGKISKFYRKKSA